MATQTTIDAAQQAIAGLEAERGKQVAVVAKAGAELAELEHRRLELQVDQDLGAGSYGKELDANRRRQGELRGAQDRAQAAVNDLEARVKAISEPLAARRMDAIANELATLEPQAGALWRRYRSALEELATVASEMLQVRHQIAVLEGERVSFCERRRLPRPRMTLRPPVPPLVHDGWLHRSDGPKHLGVWLASQEGPHGPLQDIVRN